LISRSPDATRALGAALGRALPPGTLVALDGDLGSGKTCFVQGLAEGLGVADPVTSPTYALLQTYSGRLDLHHFDAYMEGRERALLLDGGLEWMHAGGVAAVEWAKRVEDVLPRPRLSIVLEHVGLLEPAGLREHARETTRRLSISVQGLAQGPMERSGHGSDEGSVDAVGPSEDAQGSVAILRSIVRDLERPPGIEEVL
jgi:tRNA threonylcarbamoyladenosine biosynthesis protein TsaE